MRTIRGYVLAAAAVAILVAAVVLLVVNLGNTWDLHLYTKTIPISRAWAMVLAAIGGLIVYFTLRVLLPKAIADLRAGARARREKSLQRALKEKRRDAAGAAEK